MTFKNGEIFAVTSLTKLKATILSSVDKLIEFENLNSWIENTDADIIVFAGVHFMAETAKIMSPNKKVLIPDINAGCSLAESITAEDVRKLKKKYPGVPVVTYVNTSAEVKAETDVCCTSANGVKVVESLGVKEVIFLPDIYLAKYVAALFLYCRLAHQFLLLLECHRHVINKNDD